MPMVNMTPRRQTVLMKLVRLMYKGRERLDLEDAILWLCQHENDPDTAAICDLNLPYSLLVADENTDAAYHMMTLMGYPKISMLIVEYAEQDFDELNRFSEAMEDFDERSFESEGGFVPTLYEGGYSPALERPDML